MSEELPIPDLIQALADRRAQRKAYKSLVAAGDAAVEPLIQALSAKNRKIRSWAAKALGEISSPLAIVPLEKAAKDRNQKTRANAVRSLGAIQGARASMIVLRAMHDKTARVRACASQTLMSLGNRTSLPRKVLAEAAFSARERYEILESLRRVGFWRGFRYVRYTLPEIPVYCAQLLQEEEGAVREGAKAVLDYLTLMRPVERVPEAEAGRLLRPAAGPGEPPDPDRLLRPSQAPTGKPVKERAKRGWLSWLPLPGNSDDRSP
jgi:HEAT repeat protein